MTCFEQALDGEGGKSSKERSQHRITYFLEELAISEKDRSDQKKENKREYERR